MKNTLIVVFFLIFVISIAATGCQKQSPEEPSVPPTATPTIYVTGFGEAIDNFQDGDMQNDFNLTWTAANDSADSGTSTVDSFGLSAGNGSTHGLAITTTVNCQIDPVTSDYASLDLSAYSGYALIECPVPPLDLNTNNMSVVFDHIISDSTLMSVKIFIFSGSSQYLVSSAITPPLTWSTHTVDFSAMSPGGAYTTDDVLSNAAKIVIALRYRDVPGSSKQVGYFIDNVKLKSIP